MKSAIVYYSQTGNTRMIARAIRKGISSAAGQCDVFKLKRSETIDLSRYDLIGIGCPVISYREPANVKAFIDDLPYQEGKHGFVFTTHATVLGRTLATMSWALHLKGIVIIGSYHCYADAFVPCMPYPYYTTGHPDQIDLEEAEAFGREMVELSQRIACGQADLIPEPKMANWGQKPDRPRVQMTLNREKCHYPQCSLCVDNCPMSGIDLSDDPWIFQRDCICCFFCEQICPYGAIEFDWESRWRELQTRFKIYRKAAEKAERQGLLRRYYEVEIDNPDKIRFKVFTGRPRITVA